MFKLGFKVGDIVIGNEKAGHYHITKPGTRWLVVQVCDTPLEDPIIIVGRDKTTHELKITESMSMYPVRTSEFDLASISVVPLTDQERTQVIDLLEK